MLVRVHKVSICATCLTLSTHTFILSSIKHCQSIDPKVHNGLLAQIEIGSSSLTPLNVSCDLDLEVRIRVKVTAHRLNEDNISTKLYGNPSIHM